MKYLLKTTASLALLAASAMPVFAQDGEWSYEASIYLFASETTTGVGPLEGKLSFSDALDNLDMTFTGAFAAHNGRWGVLADYMRTDISFSSSTPGGGFTGVDTALKTQIFNGYVSYRTYQTDTVDVDIAAGFRWFDTQTDLTPYNGTTPAGTVSVSENWIDPVIGVRARFDISDKWTGTAFADYGGFSSDSETWQVLLTADYAFNENWVARIGYRHIAVDHKIDGTDFSFDQSGPILAAAYRF